MLLLIVLFCNWFGGPNQFEPPNLESPYVQYISEKTIHLSYTSNEISSFSLPSHLVLTSLFPLPSLPFSPTSLFLLLLLPSILTFALCLLFRARSWCLVVPSLQMARSDHLLMTVEQRKAFPAAAAWHPAQCAHTHTHK